MIEISNYTQLIDNFIKKYVVWKSIKSVNELQSRKIWFSVWKNGKIVAISSVLKVKNQKVYKLKSDYVSKKYRRIGLWKKMVDARLKYIANKNKNAIIKISVEHKFQRNYMESLGFSCTFITIKEQAIFIKKITN